MHGSTNNTFHINGVGRSRNSTSGRTALDAGVLQAETLAQAAERGGKKVAQIEWAGGRSGTIDGPTLDFRNFRSGRGVATNYIAPADRDFTRVRLQFDHPAASPAVRSRRPTPAPATGWTNVPRSYSPAKEMRLRVLDAGVDKYGLNAYIYDSKNDRKTRYDRVLFSTHQERRRQGRRPQGGRVGRRQGQDPDDRRARRQDRRVPGQGRAADPDLSQVRLFHTSVTRAIATWPNWPGEPGFTGTFEDFVAERFPSSQAGDFAVLEAGIVSEETYIEQGQYWESATTR